jgi:carbamoyl-phosphate synthase large subunit
LQTKNTPQGCRRFGAGLGRARLYNGFRRRRLAQKRQLRDDGRWEDPLESTLFSDGLDGVNAAYAMPFPALGEKPLLERIDTINKTHALDIIIPCLDSEIPNYLALADELKARKITVALPSVKAFARRGKANLAQLGKDAGVAVPTSLVAPSLYAAYSACAQIGYPLYLKGRLCDARYVASSADVAAAFHQLTAVWGAPVIAQALLRGEEYDVVGLGDGKGGILGSCAIRKMMLSDRGKAFSGVVVADPQLQAQVARVIKTLRWRGPFELEFIKGPYGHALIEMNPRFPAWVDFPSQIGCNLPAALVANLIGGRHDQCAPCEAGRMFVRHCVDLAGDIAQLAELSVTGTRDKSPAPATAAP